MSTYVSPTIPSLCSLGPRPLVMTGALVQLLRQHFQDADNLEDRDLARENTQFLWSADDRTRLAIESITQWKTALTERRPALIIKRNAYRSSRLGIGNRMMGTFAEDGHMHFANFWQGSHTIFCLAGEGAECEKLAAEVFRELNEFSSIIRQSLKLHRFEVAEVGDLALLEEASENFVVPVSVAYAFEQAWRLRTSTPALRRIDLRYFQP